MSARGVVRGGVVGLFVLSGITHVVRPQTFEEFLPEATPHPTTVNAVAAVVELACAYGLVRRRSWAGRASAATLLAVWPSNVHFAVRAAREHGPRSGKALIGYARLPLQIPMIWAVLEPDAG